MRYPVIVHPDELLRRPNKEVVEITDELETLLDDMYETMIAHDGIGIAAPQIGKNLQVALVEVEEDDLFELINPRIVSQSGESVDLEGCLSLPHMYGTVKRAETIVVRYYDREGEEMEVEASGYLARAFQHEIDHLNGILFTDKMIERIPESDIEQYMEEHAND